MRMTAATFSGFGIEVDVHLFGQNLLNAKKEACIASPYSGNYAPTVRVTATRLNRSHRIFPCVGSNELNH
jgi:hypothetical protein